jgi:hypothetical protein
MAMMGAAYGTAARSSTSEPAEDPLPMLALFLLRQKALLV